MNVLDAYPWIADRFSFIRTEGNGLYAVCDCPLRNHDNSRLKLWVGRDGRLMLGCYACGPKAKLEILRAQGLSWKDCFPEGTQIERCHQEVVAKYLYRDERGELLYMTLRLEPGRGGKDKEFSQRRPNPAFNPLAPAGPDNRKWLHSLGDVRRVLYRLPELRRADPRRPVFLVAGEKDADNLRDLGLLATTNVCGESAEWQESYSLTLAGRHVVVIEDADAVGRRHANEVVGSLLAHARTVTRCRLPGKDATAYLTRRQRERDAASLFGTPGTLKGDFVNECLRAPVWAPCPAADRWTEV